MWSRGRHFSPSLPGDRYLTLGSKSDLRAEISGSIVWYDALAPRPEVLLSFSAFYANNVHTQNLPYSVFAFFFSLKQASVAFNGECWKIYVRLGVSVGLLHVAEKTPLVHAENIA